MNVQQLLNNYLTEHIKRKPGADTERVQHCINALNDIMGYRAVSSLTRAHGRKYVRVRSKTCGNGTIRRELGCLIAALNHARKEGRIDQIPHIDLPPEPAPLDRWLTRAEAGRLEVAAQYADHVFAMDQGSLLVEGTAEEVFEDPRVIASYLGE